MGYIQYKEQGRLGLITISRQEALNALNSKVLEELESVLDNIDTKNIRCLILTGAGKRAFAAGADIGEMCSLSKEEGEAFGRKGNEVFRKIETFPLPVIAAVNGFALGGGCELAMSCDIRICSENAVFGQPEVSLGITPGFGGTQRLPRLVGAAAAKKMLYTGQNITAEEALKIGLVSEIYPAEQLLEKAMDIARQVAQNAPIAVQNTKRAVNQGLDYKMDDALLTESKLFGECFSSCDQKEGMTAFMEKRKHKDFLNR